MENNNQEFNPTYKVVDYQEKKQSKNNFSKSVFIPFVSGILGTTLVIGTCFGVPQIRNQLLGVNETSVQTSSPTKNENNSISSSVTQISLSSYSDTAISVAEKVRPSIVGITVQYSVNSIFSRNPSTSEASGSGIIISEDGYILTNNHIVSSNSSSSYYSVSEATSVNVYLYNDETAYPAKIVGTDEQTDLAVIKIDKTGLKSAELGDSNSVKVGEFSMAVGNPLGLESSVTCGIISAVNRKVTDSDGKTYNLIQTDAAINSGNSGGALVNAEGKVIGINTLKLSGTGIEGMGFAIPISQTVDIYEQLIQYNKVKRPYIGISGLDLDEETAKRNNLVVGIYVKAIDDFSAAEKAGLKVGDVIIEADGKAIKNMDELNEIKNAKSIGDKMNLKIVRNGEEKNVEITLQEQ